MNTTQNIFIVKQVSFAQGERDPFGFDDFAKRLGEKYLPFSGTVAKPAYFLFVAYVKYILKNSIQCKNKKQESEYQIRLEKLLVYCWKTKFSKAELKGGVIGNSKDKNDIDISTGKWWNKQNCFKIYTDGENKFQPTKTLEYYCKTVGRREIPILKEFLINDYKNDPKKLTGLETRLKKGNSIFNNHLLSTQLKNIFKNELKANIKDKNKPHPEYWRVIEPYFNKTRFKDEVFLKTFKTNSFYYILFSNT
jgi:hypothetical protein